jgi:uncharacterized protein
MKKALILAIVTAAAGIVLSVVYMRSQAVSPPQPEVVANKPEPPLDVTDLEAKATRGDTDAQLQLGKAYTEGRGVKLDYKKAIRWYGLAATNGNVEAEAMVGELVLARGGGTNAHTEAMKWLTKAAQDGSAAAQYDLGYMYERGQKVPHDEKMAAHWYQLAAEGGEPLAQFDYGQRCCVGLGLPADQVEGLKWMLIAAAHGQTDSAERAKLEEKKMTSDQIDEAKRRAAAFSPRPKQTLAVTQPVTNTASSQ